MLPSVLNPRANQNEGCLDRDSVETPYSAEQVVRWLRHEGHLGDHLPEALGHTGLLVPGARRIVAASRAACVALPAPEQLLTPAGMAWLERHAPGCIEGLPRGDESSRACRSIPGLALSPETDEDPAAEQVAGSYTRTQQTVGHYLLREVLSYSVGRMVYAAESVFDGGRLALKLVTTLSGPESEGARRYLNGAMVASHLNLPGCLTAVQAAREFESAFLVMPLLDEGSVKDRHERGGLEAPEATALCARAARTLAEIHAAGFAHGNVKAGNLMMGPQGVVLSDFALPDDALVPWAGVTASLQRADVDALVSVCSELLGPARGEVGKSWQLAAENPSALEVADALDEAVRHHSFKRTDGLRPDLLDTRREVQLPPRLPSLGDVLGKCRLTRKIGEGATGVVYRATHQSLDVEVAVKVLSSATDSAEELSRTFRSEARLLARLNHPHIVRIWDFEARSDFPPFLVLELIDGQNLAELVHQKGRLTTAEAIPLFCQVVSGLVAAHQQTGLVHRDIKPANILLTADGTAKVADFGLAFALEAGKSRPSGCVGTPAYVSPEQALGDEAVDFRADVYSLGVTLYQAVTGSLPFTGRSPMEVINKHLTVAPVPPDQVTPSVGPALSAVVLRMMAKKPDDRYPSYQSLSDALAEVTAGGQAASGTPHQPIEKKKTSVIRRLFGL